MGGRRRRDDIENLPSAREKDEAIARVSTPRPLFPRPYNDYEVYVSVGNVQLAG
jgi:hypothetical protein